MNDLPTKDGSGGLRKFVNFACAIFILLLITILFLHKGSFENVRAVITAEAAVRGKYGSTGNRLTLHPVGIYSNPASNERVYVYEFWYANRHGTVQEESDGHTFNVLRVKED
jgi:hypothetical protein